MLFGVVLICTALAFDFIVVALFGTYSSRKFLNTSFNIIGKNVAVGLSCDIIVWWGAWPRGRAVWIIIFGKTLPVDS